MNKLWDQRNRTGTSISGTERNRNRAYHIHAMFALYRIVPGWPGAIPTYI